MIQAAHVRRLLWVAVLVVSSAAALGGAYLGLLWLSGNFNTVFAGEMYRSAQLSPEQIDAYVSKYGIRTIVNLRGNNTGQPWYDAEVDESRKLQINHVDFVMSARQELPAARARQLMALLRQAPKPILIHCKAGADRSGLVSALYLATIKGLDPALAGGQLSIDSVEKVGVAAGSKS